MLQVINALYTTISSEVEYDLYLLEGTKDSSQYKIFWTDGFPTPSLTKKNKYSMFFDIFRITKDSIIVGNIFLFDNVYENSVFVNNLLKKLDLAPSLEKLLEKVNWYPMHKQKNYFSFIVVRPHYTKYTKKSKILRDMNSVIQDYSP